MADTEMMVLAAWCKKVGISRPWGTTLCQQGRVTGAVMDRGWWMVPADTALPDRQVPRRVLEAQERHKVKAEEAQRVATVPRPVESESAARERAAEEAYWAKRTWPK